MKRLDPFTLRWLADEHVREAASWEKYAADGYALDSNDVGHARSMARRERMTAKRLRNLATRAENKRS